MMSGFRKRAVLHGRDARLPMKIPRRRVGALFLVFVLLLGMASSTVHASPLPQSDDVEVTRNEVNYNFAQQVTFTLEATSEADITQAYLFFRATDDEETESVSLPIEDPSREVKVEHRRDLRYFPLSPFATVTFWWQIEDAAGSQLKTEPKQFTYKDDRFSWRQVESTVRSGDQDAAIVVHWIEGEGDPAFGQAALDVAEAGVAEANAELRAPLPDPIDIYIYDTQQNLKAAMLLAGRDWVSGQARPELGVIVVAVPFAEGYKSRMKRYLPHEIAHLLVYQLVTPAGYKHVPEWLDEGLATANERLPTPTHAAALEQAREEGRLISLEDLCVPFSPNSSTAFLAYAQSGSVVRFIREQYGADGIRALLAAYADGASCASGVREALGITLNGLETRWRASLEPQAPWRAWVDQIGVWVGLWLLTLLMAVPMIGGLRRR